MIFRFTIFLALLSPAACALGETSTTRPFPGVIVTQEVRVDPHLRLHAVTIDLSNPAVHLRVCPGAADPDAEGPWETALLSVSKIARREKLDVAVNGSYFRPKDAKEMIVRKDPYFEGNWAQACGWTVSDGRLWSDHPVSPDFSSFVVAESGRAAITSLDHAPKGATQVVSGIVLLSDGKNVGPANDPAPRTAVGLDADGKTMTLLVIDGRRPDYSAGLSMKNTAAEMLRLGCTNAISLDGGGSSTLVVRHGDQWPVVNYPSDGHGVPIPLSLERPVANALGIVVDRPKEGP